MEFGKKTYQEPDVTKVEFDFNEAIATSNCIVPDGRDDSEPLCFD